MEGARSPDVTWQAGMPRNRRWSSLGQRGATVWFTGLPASGKSTIAGAVEEMLVASRRAAYLIDGDNLRHGLCGDLGFSAEDREENVRRAAEVAHLLADAGIVALVSLVSPYASGRDRARRIHEDDGIQFVEVHVSTPVEECMRRDPKGLYARAQAGELRGFTGVDDPYEPPERPELVLGPELPVDEAARAVLRKLAPPES
jgi:adenylyl-sulfate kinase